jgi:GNAT superfamily N-acetyltransferase
MSITHSLVIRFAQPADRDWCAGIDQHVRPEVVERKIGFGEIIVAEIEGQLIGYLRLEYLWSTIPYIALIFLPSEHRHQGVGRAMLAFLETFLRSHGHSRLLSSSQVNEPGPQAWHRAVGFEECGLLAGLNDGGIGEVFFRKSLNA